MRVLVVVHGFPPSAQGGSEVYAHTHARALAADGHDILVLTREQDPNRPEYEVRRDDHNGLATLRVNNTFRNTRTFEDTYSNGAVDAIARGVIDDFKPDAAHIHHLTCLSTGIVGLLAERRIPVILTLHDYWLMCHRGQLLDVDYRVCDGPRDAGTCARCLGPAGSAGPVQFLGARVLRAIGTSLPEAPVKLVRRGAVELAGMVARDGTTVDRERHRTAHMRALCDEIAHFIAPSRHLRDRFVDFGVAPERITVADYGFDHRPFEVARPFEGRDSGGPEDSVLRLGFLGSLMVSKGPHVLLEAVRKLPPGSVSVDLFGAPTPYHGDDGYRRQLEPLLNQPGVHAHGPIAQEAVPAALAALDALVVPSIWPENSPLVIHEAFLAGVPVIAARIGGIPELVTDGTNGLLFSPGDVDDLSRLLSTLLAEPALLDTLRARIPAVRSIQDDVRMACELYRRPLHEKVTSGRPRVAAVVLNYKTPDDTLLAVKSLLASRRPIDDVIVVDNDATENARDRLRSVEQDISYVLSGRNLGFSGGMNLGIRHALARGAERVLLVNSDVIVPPDCVERLERCLDTKGAGIAGPVILGRSDPESVASLGMSYSSRTGRMRHRGVGVRLRDGGRIESDAVDAISGCLMLVRREVFDAIGLLDEDFFFSFEELDFCLKAGRAGFPTVLDGSAVAYHEGGRSIGADAPLRLYFAARNHLLLASRNGNPQRLRTLSILALNIAHAFRTTGATLPARLSAVARGVRDHFTGRLGDPSRKRDASVTGDASP
jgi:GT2 family glycosyltransferase/glycosyltransferase involved in cell wall biosynthesis